jgi:hypothetical protein
VSVPIADRAAAAAARTVEAGSARIFSAWTMGAPVPQAGDRRCEGVADLAGRRARVSHVLFFTERLTVEFLADHGHDQPGEPTEMIFDGGRAHVRTAGRWTSLPPDDPDGPRGPNDPLWPLDALFGARDDVAEVGPETVRGVATIRCRLTVDLARADAALPAGVSVPAGPYRALRRMPAEVWLDADGRARRVAVSTEPAAAAGEQTWAITELWDFGIAVDITLPGPDGA